jgi:hypothetical protein
MFQMKVLYPLLAFIFLSAVVSSQPLATTFQNAEQLGISISELDSTYKSAVHAVEELGVFNHKQKEFINHYVKLHQDLSTHLVENDFQWPKDIKLFTRVYFAEDGSIDYFLLNPRQAGISEEKNKLFFNLLNGFVSDYKIELSADTKFAQCSPVTYKSPTTKL